VRSYFSKTLALYKSCIYLHPYLLTGEYTLA